MSLLHGREMLLPLRPLVNVILLSVLASGSAFAQRPAVAADSTKTATVRRLMELTKTGEAIVRGMEAAVPAQRRAYPECTRRGLGCVPRPSSSETPPNPGLACTR